MAFILILVNKRKREDQEGGRGSMNQLSSGAHWEGRISPPGAGNVKHNFHDLHDRMEE